MLIRIGVLYEGKYDEESIKSIIEKIFKINFPYVVIEFICCEARGPILSKVEPALGIFFEGNASCDLAVFLTDTDRDNKCGAVKQQVRKFLSSAKIVIGCPSPSFEQWFFKEEVAIKKVLGLNQTAPLPFKNYKKKPKERLLKIIKISSTDITMSKRDIFLEISKSLDLEALLRKDKKNFRKFYFQLVKEIKEIIKLRTV